MDDKNNSYTDDKINKLEGDEKVPESESGSWFIMYVRPQQKINRLMSTLLNDYKSFVEDVVAPTQNVTKWVGSEKKIRKTLAMGSYLFVKATPELEFHQQKIEFEVDCKINVWPWEKGEKEIQLIREAFDGSSTMVSEIKPGSFVTLIGEGYKQLELKNVQVQEINGNSVKVRVWIMKGCDPVDLDVNINDIAPSNNAWEEI